LFDVIGAGLRAISATVFSLIAAFRFLSRTIVDIFKMLNEARKFNLGGAGDIAKQGLADTQEQFRKDMESLGKLISGESEAGENYYHKGEEGAARVGAQLTRTFGSSMRTKIQAFSDSLSDIGGKVGDAVIKAFKGMEDALVNFVRKGKLDFRSLADSIINDLIRIAIQQTVTKPLLGLFGFAKGGVFQGGNQIKAYAKGGVVNRPTMFAMGGQGNFGIMGEGGSEAILPLKRGKGGRLGVEGGGGTSVVVNVDASGNKEVSGDEEKGRQLGEAISAAVTAQLVKEKMPGGLLYT
jgi:lambda family phage tail tape measure protein